MKPLLAALACGSAALSLWAAEPVAPPTTNELINAVLDRAERALLRFDYKDAIEAAGSVLPTDPLNARAYLLRARAYEAMRDHAKAVEDFTKVIELGPEPQVFQHRGQELFRLGKAKEAVADFDKVLELMPGQAAQHWQRGIALYYAKRFEDGRKQFELHQTANQHDVENAVWHFLCVTRSAGIEKARAAFIEIERDRRIPMAQIHDLFAGKGSKEDVLAAAEAGQPSAEALRGRLFYAHLYLALYHEALGNTQLTEEHLVKATGPYAMEHYMGDVARVHLKLLRAQKGN